MSRSHAPGDRWKRWWTAPRADALRRHDLQAANGRRAGPGPFRRRLQLSGAADRTGGISNATQRTSLGMPRSPWVAAFEVVGGAACVMFCTIVVASVRERTNAPSAGRALVAFGARIGRFATGTLEFQISVARSDRRDARAFGRSFRRVRRRGLDVPVVVIALTLFAPAIGIRCHLRAVRFVPGRHPPFGALGDSVRPRRMRCGVRFCSASDAAATASASGCQRTAVVAHAAPLRRMTHTAGGFVTPSAPTGTLISIAVTTWSALTLLGLADELPEGWRLIAAATPRDIRHR